MRRLTAIILVALVVSAAAQPVTQPPVAHNDPAWESATAEFSTALLDTTGSTDLPALLAPDVAIHSFGGDPAPLLRLLATLRDMSGLGAYAYSLPATSIADDIAESVAGSALSDDVKRQMMPSAQSRGRANAIALQWVSRALRAGEGDSVAVMILAPNNPGQDAAPADEGTPLTFVLFKGVKDAEGKYRITTIIYGDPLTAER